MPNCFLTFPILSILTDQIYKKYYKQSEIKDAVENFEKLDNLVRKIDKFVQIGFLNKSQTMLVFGLCLCQRVTDEITSFLGQTDLKSISFRDCL